MEKNEGSFSMISRTKTPSILIAPCGMNCGLCMAYMRERNRCSGCNTDSTQKARHCFTCRIKNCTERNGDSSFCFSCEKYPCTRLRQLDKRYRTKYSMSMLENLNGIRVSGLDRFMEVENQRWACPKCGYPICVHNKICYHCGLVHQKQ
jgi:hypothetical protein